MKIIRENTRCCFRRSRQKKEIQEGLIKACDIIDLIIAVLRALKNLRTSKACLMEEIFQRSSSVFPALRRRPKKLCFTERQASAILEMRLYKLIGLEILALEKEHKETLRKIREYAKNSVQQRRHGSGDQGRFEFY
mgnify:CR=1 FL=1